MWGLPSRPVTGPLVRSYRTISPLPGRAPDETGDSATRRVAPCAPRSVAPARHRARPRTLPATANVSPVKSDALPGGIFSVALSVPFGPPDYGAHCPVEFGLSSPGAQTKAHATGSDYPLTRADRRFQYMRKPLGRQACRKERFTPGRTTGTTVERVRRGSRMRTPSAPGFRDEQRRGVRHAENSVRTGHAAVQTSMQLFAINRIAQYGVSDGGKMHSNLMGPAGLNRHVQQ